MSLLWTDRRAALLPGRAVLATGGEAVDSAEAGMGWEGAVTALQELLAAQRPSGALSLTLSHHFLRLFLLDPPPTWLRHAEMQSWVSECLADTLGGDGAWQHVWPHTPPGRPVPVCAIPADRLKELQVLLARHGCRARHIRPWLDVIWSRRHHQLARVTGWYALVEPGMMNLLRLERGRLTRLRQRHLGEDAAIELGGMLHREALLAGISPGGEVWLERTGTALDLQAIGPEWRVHELAGPTDPGLALLS
ncbi:MAG: hypothetical protein ACUVT2_10610 [Thiobacillaceae bacterium]